jgi:hypothetical protein
MFRFNTVLIYPLPLRDLSLKSSSKHGSDGTGMHFGHERGGCISARKPQKRRAGAGGNSLYITHAHLKITLTLKSKHYDRHQKLRRTKCDITLDSF